MEDSRLLDWRQCCVFAFILSLSFTNSPLLYGLCLVRTAAINTNSQLTSRFFLFIDTLPITSLSRLASPLSSPRPFYSFIYLSPLVVANPFLPLLP